MSVFRRFSNIVQQKSNALWTRWRTRPGDRLSYQQLLEQQQKLRTALSSDHWPEAGREPGQDDGHPDRSLNDAAQKAVSAGKDDLATRH